MKFRFGVILFKAKMMTVLGIVPMVDGCVSCGRTRKIVTASVSEGGLVCEDCYTGDGVWLATDLIPLWRALFKIPVEHLVKLDVGGADVEVLEGWIMAYYEGYSNVKFAKRL
jgi:DNA repair protein RecO (recombination protein O)